MTVPEKVIFDLAKRTADVIADTFGANCEVAVHDFSNLNESLIYLAGNVTNRELRSPATNLVLEELKKNSSEVQDISNYKTHSKTGITFKSSTVFLRNKENSIIGALCINYDIDSLLTLNGMLQNILSFNNQQNHAENFSSSIYEVINNMVEQISASFGKAPSSLHLRERIEFTKLLDEKGVFLIKGSTEYIATIFGVSKFTIYNYLQKIHVNKHYFKNKEAD